MRKIILVLSILMLANVAWAVDAKKENSMNKKGDEVFNTSSAYFGRDGKTLYKESCQGCHMEKGEGTKQGVGMYPPLANSAAAEMPEHTADVVMNGLRGMPGFWNDLDDEQIANVSNFVATNFGNKSKDKISVEAVKAMRPKTKLVYQ